MILFKDSLYTPAKNAYYNLVLKHPNGTQKSLTVLGDGVEGTVIANERAGFYISEFQKI